MDNFVVSARKYRPATFVSVVGQGHITSTLKNAVSRNQLAHAYLFCGPRGVGKTTCARIFAKAINCLSPVGDEACGECESCRSFNEGRSFNIHELDAASNNSVDDIRTLTEQVRIPPQIGRYSVYIIDEVHMLSSSAFNAFLKTLEEPPAHAVFILATTEKHKIIPTILSRCQIFDFNRIRVEDTVGYLRHIAANEEITADDESLHLIALKADGGMRDALSMFDKAVSFCGNTLNFKEVAATLNVLDYDTYFAATTLVDAGDYRGALLLFDEVLRKGFSGQIFLSGLAAHFRDLLMCKNPQTLPLLEISGSILDRYKEQAAALEGAFLFDAIALLAGVDGDFRAATNQRLLVELALMKLCTPAQKKNGNHDLIAPDTAPAASATALPELETTPAPVAAVQPAPQPAPAVQPAPEPAPAPAPDPIPEPVSPPAPEPTPTPVATPAPRPVAAGASPAISISGDSIASILGAATAPKPVAEPGQAPEVLTVDPDSEAKIRKFSARFLAALQQERPRIAMAFNNFGVEGNIIKVDVPSRELCVEVERNRTEILTLLVAVAGIAGMVELEVTVVESPEGLKPIKIEDKLRHLSEKNPLLADLRRELDLDIL